MDCGNSIGIEKLEVEVQIPSNALTGPVRSMQLSLSRVHHLFGPTIS